MELLIPLLIIAIVVLYIAAKTIRIVPQAAVLIIERLGKFDRVATSGLNVITPFLDRPRSVYWSGLRPGTIQIDLRNSVASMVWS